MLRRVHTSVVTLSVCVVALLWQACGGGGGGGGTQGPPVTQPGQRGTATPVPVTPGPDMVIVQSGEDIAEKAKTAPDGAIVVVAPGTYRPIVLNPGDLQGALTLFADVTGEFTNSAPAAVTIVARSTDEAAFEAFSQNDLFIDGFTLRGGTDAGFLCGDCSTITVQDCTVTSGGGDAVRFERSDDVLVFNNLLTGNKGGGVTAFGTTSMQIINNTIYNNLNDGILLTVDENQHASTNAFLRNNILNKNTPTGIVVDPGPPSSLTGFDADFDLNTNGYDGNDAGANDVAKDPLFIFPSGGDFRLAAPSSPALDEGTDKIDADLVSELEQLSTQTDGSLDSAPLDMGYHYIAPIPTPTKVPKPTRTGTPRATATRTGGAPGATPTPTHTASGPTPTPTKTTRPTRTPVTPKARAIRG